MRDLKALEFDGDAQLAFDDDKTKLRMSERQDDGYRYVFHACCDCGLVHKVAVAEDHMVWVRAENSTAEEIRRAALASGHEGFPLASPETCICAALKIGALVVRGHRHDSCFHAASLIPGVTREQIRSGIQGFVTSANRFVDRKEAMALQITAGAKSACSLSGELRGEILFSEDVIRLQATVGQRPHLAVVGACIGVALDSHRPDAPSFLRDHGRHRRSIEYQPS